MNEEIRRVAYLLHRRLGPKILAQVLGEPRLLGVEEMALGKKLPTPDQQIMLLQLDAISEQFPPSPSPRVIRTWLERPHPELGNHTPVTVLQDRNKFEKVFELAWEFNHTPKPNKPQ